MNSLSWKSYLFHFLYFSSPSLIAFQLSYSGWSLNFNINIYFISFVHSTPYNQFFLCLNLDKNIQIQIQSHLYYCKNLLNVYIWIGLPYPSIVYLIAYVCRANWRQVHVFEGKAIYKIFFSFLFCCRWNPWEL